MHPLFPHDLPDDAHPLAFVFLHMKMDGSTITFEPEHMNAMARHVFDELGAQLPATRTRRQKLALVVTPDEVGVRWDRAVRYAANAPARITRGQLPPGLELEGGRISGVPTQSGRWLVEVRTGPQIHYQAPLTGPVGPYNKGSWVDVDTPLEAPVPAGIDDLPDDEFEELERMVQRRREAESNEKEG